MRQNEAMIFSEHGPDRFNIWFHARLTVFRQKEFVELSLTLHAQGTCTLPHSAKEYTYSVYMTQAESDMHLGRNYKVLSNKIV